MRDPLYRVVAFLVAASLTGCGAGSSGQTTVPAAAAVSSPAPSNAAAGVTFALAGFPVAGQAGTFTITVDAKNASGTTISGPFASPLTLTDSDTTGVVTLAPSTLTAGTSTVTLTYSGAKLAGPVTIGAKPATGSITVTPLTFSPNADAPLTGGTSAKYTSTETDTIITPAPPAGTQPSVSTNTYTETLASNATFGGVSGLIDERYDYPVDPPYTGIMRDDVYVQLVAGTNGVTITEVGASSNQNSTNVNTNSTYSTTSATTYASPYLTIDVLPHQNGRTWSERQAYQQQATYKATTTSTSSANMNADGSGTQTATFPASTSTTTINSDGSISIASSSSGTNSTYSWGVPTTIGGQRVIVLTKQTGNQPAVTANLPDWYPNGGSATPIETANATDKGTVALPAQCNVSAGIATSAEDVRIDRFSLAATQGFYRTTTEDQYLAAGVGLVCDISTATSWNYQAATTGSLTLEAQSVTVTSMTSGGFGPLSSQRKTTASGTPALGFGRGLAELIRRRQLERVHLGAGRPPAS